MRNKSNKYSFPSSIYEQHLSVINGIKFTPREIDVIACVLHGKNDKAIAQLLTTPGKPHLSFKTIRAHLDNITRKIESGMRQNLIKFIEESGKFQIIHEYYTALLVCLDFKKILYNISNIKFKEEVSLLVVANSIDKKQDEFLNRLLVHLKLAGAKIKFVIQEEIIDVIKLLTKSYNTYSALYTLPHESSKEEYYLTEIEKYIHSQGSNFQLKDVVFLGSTRKDYDILSKKNLHYINTEQENYYFLFFDILKCLFPVDSTISDVAIKFLDKFNNIQNIGNSRPYMNIELENIASYSSKKHRKFKFIIAVILIILSLGLFYIFSSELNITSNPTVRSDFILPVEPIMLDRSSMVKKIKDNIDGKHGIQTIALVGIGGAGKTTLARLYGQQAKADVVWEFNAENQEVFKKSFEKLASNLAVNNNDKEVLRGICNIEDQNDKENQLINFVKERLKLANKWLLIYDNVEDFVSIQKYFPQDPGTWGKGRIIITTRNGNIQNSNYINHSIYIGELDTKEKYELFIKILPLKDLVHKKENSEETIKKFLQSIPSFPLDISIAAYYLQATKISFDQYLTRLNQNKSDFEKMQYFILAETGDYLKTRYNIISLSLSDLIDKHTDFKNLLLFISMLDSQDIPRELLDQYKNNIVVDNFIYQLRKYSLITGESVSSFGPGISLHRSAQNITLAYLSKSSDDSINKSLQSIADSISNYSDSLLDALNTHPTKIAHLLNHCLVFLNHKKILTRDMKAPVEGAVGKMYLTLSTMVGVDPAKAKPYLIKSLDSFQKNNTVNECKIAQIKIYLGATERELGNDNKAAALLSSGLSVYNKNCPTKYAQRAFGAFFLGLSYLDLGDYRKAQNLFDEALQLYKLHMPKLYIFAKLKAAPYFSFVNTKLGEFEKAKEIGTEALSLSKEYLPDDYLYHFPLLTER